MCENFVLVQYTHGVMRWHLWPHDILPCVLMYSVIVMMLM